MVLSLLTHPPSTPPRHQPPPIEESLATINNQLVQLLAITSATNSRLDRLNAQLAEQNATLSALIAKQNTINTSLITTFCRTHNHQPSAPSLSLPMPPPLPLPSLNKSPSSQPPTPSLQPLLLSSPPLTSPRFSPPLSSYQTPIYTTTTPPLPSPSLSPLLLSLPQQAHRVNPQHKPPLPPPQKPAVIEIQTPTLILSSFMMQPQQNFNRPIMHLLDYQYRASGFLLRSGDDPPWRRVMTDALGLEDKAVFKGGSIDTCFMWPDSRYPLSTIYVKQRKPNLPALLDHFFCILFY